MFRFLLFALGAISSMRLAYGQDILFTKSALSQPYQAPMALGPKGIYVSGASFDPQGSAGPMASQSVLIKYDSSGARLWSQQVAEPKGVFPQSIATDATAVYVAGSTGFFVNYQAFVRKYDDAGKEMWFRQFPVGGNQKNQTGASVAADSSGVYVAASNASYAWQLDAGNLGIIRKFSLTGDELWSRTVAMSSLNRLAVNATGLYVAGFNSGGGFVSRYTADGDESWRHVFSGQSTAVETDLYVPGAIAIDSTGIYIGGEILRQVEGGFEHVGPQGAFLLKLDPNGKELWTQRFGDASAFVNALAVYDSGLYAAGATSNSMPGQCRAGSFDPFVRKYDGAGAEQWTRQFGTPLSEFAGGIIADTTGVYISGGASSGNGSGITFLTKIGLAPAALDASRPQILTECVLNSANYVGGGVSPGEIVTIYGRGIGPPDPTTLQVQPDGRIATFLGLTRIRFDGIAAPLLYVSATQVSAVVPYEVSGKSTVSVDVAYQGVRSDPLVLPVFAVRPAAFTRDGSGSGQGLMRNEDGTLNSPENPAARGSVVTMYLTGAGLSTPAVPDGTIAGSFPPQPLSRIEVMFDDPADPFGDDVLTAEIISDGGMSGAVAGLVELRFRVPATTRTGGAVPVHVWQATQVDPVVYGPAAVTVALR